MSIYFIDRDSELRSLEEALSSDRPELVIVYGRRRIGKTFLIRQLLEGRRGVYLVVNHTDPDLALRDLARQLLSQVQLPYEPLIRDFDDLYRLFEGSRAQLIVIDEFQRLHGTGAVAKLQAFWDQAKERSRLKLVLSGSSVGMMERIGLSHESPLYGRASRILRLGPLPYRAARLFTEAYAEEDRVRTFAVFGGTPGYLALLDDRAPLIENIRRLVLSRAAPLREEPLVSLSMELRDPSRYIAVLEAVASGATKLGEIADKAGVEHSEVGKYLRVLERELDLVERRYPLLEEGRRGRARYYVKDHFVRFWFRFVFPNTHLLELELEDRVLDAVARHLDLHVSQAFEEVALEHFSLLAREGAVGFTRIGRWWRGDVEIDFVAIDEASKMAYFAEVKWSTQPVDQRVLYGLARKAEEFPWRRGERREVYVLYSRAGFTFTGDRDVLLFSLRNLQGLFERHRPLKRSLKPPAEPSTDSI